MSNIYIQEPPTNGKVLMKTSAGDIDVELWSKEAPKACRNFVQLCMEGYYDGTIFHRVVPDFVVQGGDPTGTGTGGESVYGHPFKDEFHSRLRFNRRGLVAMANAGPHDNGSQFFFTLGRADELNNKHTIFGKVTGDTVYNMLRLAEVECNKDERPLNPHKIRTAEVLHNPFDDIVPREIKKVIKEKDKEDGKKSQSKATNSGSVLVALVFSLQTMKGKSKSSHDLLKDDPRLSSVPKWLSVNFLTSEMMCFAAKRNSAVTIRALLWLPLYRPDGVLCRSALSEELRREARQLKKELLAIKQRKEDNAKPDKDDNEGDTKASSEAVAEYLEERKKYEEIRKQKLKKGSSREAQTLALLDRFKSKLSTAITEAPDKPEEDVEELGEDDDSGWMAHVLHFNEQTRKVKDANMQDEDTFEIYDPRNPVNKRRREESKKIMKEKKARR
uniref:Spliceosome-associated protein CWC27 homolog n=1 Tax=Scleropages formosus TaxID=113540 RepID=A0A8C9R2X5_SCLFO